MRLQEIKKAVDAGLTVHWANNGYKVIVSNGVYYIKCISNNNCIGLTWNDYVTMNGKPEDFYINTL